MRIRTLFQKVTMKILAAFHFRDFLIANLSRFVYLIQNRQIQIQLKGKNNAS